MGGDLFVRRYGFGPSKEYLLWDQGQSYDSKAILGVALRHATGKAASSSEFHGGVRGAAQVLTELGFTVFPISATATKSERPGGDEWREASEVGAEEAQAAWATSAHEALREVAARYHGLVTQKELAGLVQMSSGIRTKQQMHYWIGEVLAESLASAPARTSRCCPHCASTPTAAWATRTPLRSASSGARTRSWATPTITPPRSDSNATGTSVRRCPTTVGDRRWFRSTPRPARDCVVRRPRPRKPRSARPATWPFPPRGSATTAGDARLSAATVGGGPWLSQRCRDISPRVMRPSRANRALLTFRHINCSAVGSVQRAIRFRGDSLRRSRPHR